MSNKSEREEENTILCSFCKLSHTPDRNHQWILKQRAKGIAPSVFKWFSNRKTNNYKKLARAPVCCVSPYIEEAKVSRTNCSTKKSTRASTRNSNFAFDDKFSAKDKRKCGERWTPTIILSEKAHTPNISEMKMRIKRDSPCLVLRFMPLGKFTLLHINTKTNSKVYFHFYHHRPLCCCSSFGRRWMNLIENDTESSICLNKFEATETNESS